MQGFFYRYTTYEDISKPFASEVDCFGVMDLTAIRVIDDCFSFLTELPGIQTLIFRDSCNGLILFANRRHRYAETLGYIVCNPTTKEWQDAPTCGNPCPLSTFTYLAFDPLVSSHFQLFQFEAGWEDLFISVHAYSSEKGTWSQNLIGEHGEHGELEGWHRQVQPSFDIPHGHWSFVNGILHLIVWDWDEDEHLILAVDVQGKTRRMITVPVVNPMLRYVSYVGQSQGRLHCITEEALDDKSYKLSIWVIQDYDTQEWVLKDTLNSRQLFIDKSCGDDMADFKVVDIHQDCDVVFFALSLNSKLMAYKMGRKEVSIGAIFEPDLVQEFARYVPYFSESPALTNKQ